MGRSPAPPSVLRRSKLLAYNYAPPTSTYHYAIRVDTPERARGEQQHRLGDRTCAMESPAPPCEPGAEVAAQRVDAAQLAKPRSRKRLEREAWDADELAVRGVLLERLRAGTPALVEAAQRDSTLMLQVIRGGYHHEERLETICSDYLKVLTWRSGIGADTILADPPSPTVIQHSEWRRRWHLDVYGEDRDGRPIIGHQLGRIDPSTFLEAFDLDMILLQYCRDLEFVSWRKRRLTEQIGATVYKQVVILDMTGLGMGHVGSKFRGPVAEVVVLLQQMYPEGTRRIFIINCPFAFRAVWSAVKSFVSEQTQQNIVILGDNKREQHAAFAELGIGAAQLPSWAGGIWREGDGLLSRHAQAGSPALIEPEPEQTEAPPQQHAEGRVSTEGTVSGQADEVSVGHPSDRRLLNMVESLEKLGQAVDAREATALALFLYAVHGG